jgi:hypothetical protein
MAVAGGAKPSRPMSVLAGKLIVGPYALRQGVVNNEEEAVHRIIAGKLVFVSAYGDLIQRVMECVENWLEGDHA